MVSFRHNSTEKAVPLHYRQVPALRREWAQRPTLTKKLVLAGKGKLFSPIVGLMSRGSALLFFSSIFLLLYLFGLVNLL